MNKYPQYRLLYEEGSTRVIECSPTRRTIRFFNNSDGETTTYDLPFPYTYFRLQKQPATRSGCKIGFGIGNKELKLDSEESKIYFSPLTNVCMNHGVCMGDDPPYNDPIGDFWFSAFYNLDEAYRFLEISEAWPGALVMNKVFGSLSEWQSKSLDEVLEVNWPFYTPFDCFKSDIISTTLSENVDITPLEAFYIRKYFSTFKKQSDINIIFEKYREYMKSRGY